MRRPTRPWQPSSPQPTTHSSPSRHGASTGTCRPTPIDDKQLREFFDQAMRQAGLLDLQTATDAASDVDFGGKAIAFVEVRTVTDANNAMQLDGITLYGKRCGQPSEDTCHPRLQVRRAWHARPRDARRAYGERMPMGMNDPDDVASEPQGRPHATHEEVPLCSHWEPADQRGQTPDALKQFINTVMQQMF